MLKTDFLLGVLVAMLLAFAFGLYVGVRWEKSDNANAIILAQDTAIKTANQTTAAAVATTIAAAKKEATANLASRTAKMAGELDAAKKSRPDCSRDPESMGLLNSAIDASNFEEAAASGMPSALRLLSTPGRRLGIVAPKLGVPDN
jgi:hypothetical protein